MSSFVEVIAVSFSFIGVPLIFLSTLKMLKYRSSPNRDKWVFIGLIGIYLCFPLMLIDPVNTLIEHYSSNDKILLKSIDVK